MRLFIAITVNDEIKQQILKLQDQLRFQSMRGNFSRPENLHVTLVFLGETPEQRLDSLHKIIDSVQVQPFDISFSCAGCFKRHGTELWWIGADSVDPGLAALFSIHKRLVQQLEAENFNFDKKPLNTHITLGREIVHYKPIVLECPQITVRAERISLMKSEHIRGVLTYTEV
jgi:2'-5' RNA ligase